MIDQGGRRKGEGGGTRERSLPVACAAFPLRGFTLIEVVLAIGLSGVLLVLLSLAIGLYLFRVEASRSAVEDGLVARGVLRLISEDLRNAATIYTQDTSVVEQLAAAQATFNVDEIDQPQAPDTGATGGAEEDRLSVGLVGAASELRLSVLKTRAVDPVVEFGAGELQSSASPLRGITTVRYFVTQEGLTRQEASRDVDLWESDQGGGETLLGSSRVIAPEVVGLELTYSDGGQSVAAWDSEEQEGELPIAVEVKLTLRQSKGEQPEQETEATAERLRTYRMIVAMPSANPGVEADADDSGAESL